MLKSLIVAFAVSIPAAFAGATEIVIDYSEDFAHALAEDYGEREGERLKDEIRGDLERQLEKRGVEPAEIHVTILKARPNRPTFEQLANRPGLSAVSSISVGDLDLYGRAYDASDNLIGELEFDYLERPLSIAGLQSEVWSDAFRASDQFARRLVKKLAS